MWQLCSQVAKAAGALQWLASQQEYDSWHKQNPGRSDVVHIEADFRSSCSNVVNAIRRYDLADRSSLLSSCLIEEQKSVQSCELATI